MALSRRTGARFQGAIWPGFVDAMTGLLLVLMFVLTIFMMVQFVLREEISGQETQLDALSAEVSALSLALGLEQDRNATLEDRVGALTATLGDARARQEQQAALIQSLRAQTAEQAQALQTAQGRIADLENRRDELLSEAEQLNLALASLRDEVDAQAEAARLAAARREALDALVADLRARNAEAGEAQAALSAEVDDLQAQLSEEEQARLAEAAAAEALRKRLETSQAELTSMALALEEQRQRAEETLTLLAAAETAREDLNSQLAQALLQAEQGAEAREAEIARLESALDAAQSGEAELTGTLEETRAALAEAQARTRRLEEQLAQAVAEKEAVEGAALDAEEVRAQLVQALAAQRAAEAQAQEQMSAAEERAALLSQARERLAEEQQATSAAQRQQALLNQQVAALRDQLSQLQGLLDEARASEAEAEVQLQSLGNELNTALARVAAEERRRRQAEEERARLLEAERERLEAEKQDLEKYRSEFFGRLRDVLGDQEGVQIVGDRFVFSSEVLFAPGAADLSRAGELEIAKVANILRSVIDEIPEGIEWVLQVDGHTDDVPIVEGARFADNWALSQARALSVVRYLTNFLGFPPERLSANGYGEYQPVNPADTPEARAQNRRIELKLTTR